MKAYPTASKPECQLPNKPYLSHPRGGGRLLLLLLKLQQQLLLLLADRQTQLVASVFSRGQSYKLPCLQVSPAESAPPTALPLCGRTQPAGVATLLHQGRVFPNSFRGTVGFLPPVNFKHVATVACVLMYIQVIGLLHRCKHAMLLGLHCRRRRDILQHRPPEPCMQSDTETALKP